MGAAMGTRLPRRPPPTRPTTPLRPGRRGSGSKKIHAVRLQAMLVRATSRNAAGLRAMTVLGIICCGAAVRSPAITTNAKNQAPCRVKSSIAYSYGCENYHCENNQTMCEGGSTYMLWSNICETTDHTDDIALTLQYAGEIHDYEQRRARQVPWLFHDLD